ncbi:pre-rRNA-processing protein esf1 [Clarireedia jacksonii]
MPKPKQKLPKGAAQQGDAPINDPRFSNFSTDPRFRLPSKKQTRTKIDKRFSRMLKDEEFTNTAKVDRYGRKLSGDGKKKALRRLYEAESGSETSDSDEEEVEDDVEVEDDDVVEKELRRADKGYDPARGGGFSSSEDEDDEEEEDGGVEIEEAEFPDMQAEQAGVEMGEVSSRIAVVNIDWDNIRSVDLMAVFQSFVKPGGKIHKVSIYKSEFGKERMEREELEGPPKEIFAKKTEDSESDSEDDDDEELEEKIKKDLLKGDDGEEFNSAALRQYQLERLRYFYAVVECSDNDTAQAIYEATDGTEYLSSANFFDLRFIPDGVEFDDKPRDECTSVPSGYKPTEFVTDALQHSKVKLTWDQNPEEASRKDAINRAFKGSRAEIGENDLRAYLGSDSDDDSSSEVEEDAPEAGTESAPKLTKKELARQKMREALGLSTEPIAKSKSKSSGPVGNMEITFTSGLSATADSHQVFENTPDDIKEETTAEKYIRKERERKARRKEKAKALREGRDPDAVGVEGGEKKGEEEKEDLGFNDPFFATDENVRNATLKSQRKEDRKKKRAVKEAEELDRKKKRAELELLMADDPDPESGILGEGGKKLEHFDINEIQRAEKAAKKKGKKGKKNRKGGEGEGEEGEEEASKRGGLQKGFEIDVADERFSGRLYENHEFAIDPSNAKFRGTEGMRRLLEEGRRKREREVAEVGEERGKKRKGGSAGEGEGEGEDGGKAADLKGLVEMVKKKSRKN